MVGCLWEAWPEKEGSLLPVFEKVQGFFDFVFTVLYIAALPSMFVGVYSCVIVYLMVLGAVWGWGVFVWFIPVVMLGPVIAVWYRVLQRRYREYFAMLTSSTPMKWDIEAAVRGWEQIIRAGKKREKKKR